MPENTSIPQGTKILREPLLRRLSHHLLHWLLHLIDVHAMGLRLHVHKADVAILTLGSLGASVVAPIGLQDIIHLGGSNELRSVHAAYGRNKPSL